MGDVAVIGAGIAGLAAAGRAARRHGAMLGFDAEDLHSGEGGQLQVGMAKIIEGALLPSCRHVTASAPLIGAALLAQWQAELVLVGGLLAFGAVFAINSAVHSYLIVSWARSDGVSLDVGFYYMANAAGRLLGTVLSGLVYQTAGLAMCLFVSSLLVAASAVLARRL